MATTAMGMENFFTTTLSSSLTDSGLTISLNAVPTASEGYLVIDPDNASKREVIYYTSKGASSVTVPASGGRGADGTTAVSHDSGATVEMNMVAGYWEDLQSGEALLDGAITNAKLSTTAGELGGAWQDWTPDISAFGTLGNGTVDGRYMQVGKTVIGWGSFTLGSTSAVSAGFSFTPPVTPNTDYADGFIPVGNAFAFDNSSGNKSGQVLFNGTTRLRPRFENISVGIYGVWDTMASTTPFTWTTSDRILINFMYEAA